MLNAHCSDGKPLLFSTRLPDVTRLQHANRDPQDPPCNDVQQNNGSLNSCYPVNSGSLNSCPRNSGLRNSGPQDSEEANFCYIQDLNNECFTKEDIMPFSRGTRYYDKRYRKVMFVPQRGDGFDN